MKLSTVPVLSFLLGLALLFASAGRAEEIDVNAPLNPQQVDQLLGPIALYPDALVAIILPASTNPADLVLAQRYLSAGGDPDKIDDQPWSESVRALARYPMLVKWLDENLTWTRQLGATFLFQPDEVMNAVQRLRARAKANGTLTSTPQQKLLLDGDDIQIVPAQPDVIYVPYYDPSLVYGQPSYYGGPPYITYGLGLPVGFWLSYDFNWRTRVIIVGDRHHNWYEHRDWDRHPGPGGKPNYGNNWRPWTPPANRPPYTRPDNYRPNPDIIHPRPIPGAPTYPSHDSHPERPRPDAPSRDNDHNRPPAPTNNPNWNQDNRDHHTPSVPTSRPDNNVPANPSSRPPGPSNPPPSRPANTPDWNHNNQDRPSYTPPPVRQPDSNPPPMDHPPRPTGQYTNQPPPMPNHQPTARPPEVRPVNSPPPPRPASPPPPPAPKDNPRDQQPEPPR